MADLLNRDLSKFNPLAPAPYTDYRNQMSGMADRPLNDFIREQFEQGVTHLIEICLQLLSCLNT
jgi:hypothetical protein